LHVKHLGQQQVISQLHLGGGSPTFFSDEDLSALMQVLKSNFVLDPEGEYAIEVDPRTMNDDRIAHLSKLGFNRLSFGIQDFDEAVQLAIHRVQPKDRVYALIKSARAHKFDSINIDLIYGLPLQTPLSFGQTLAKVIALKPDRIALYAYAHLPERFKPQRQLNPLALITDCP